MPNPMDTELSKDRVVSKRGRARRGGLHGVFATLAEQHAEMAKLLDRVEQDPSKRRSLWPTIRIELLSHERGELREVFPALREHAETEQLAEQHEADAHDLEALIAQLDDTEPDPDSEDWGALFDQLVGTVLDHVDDEEKNIFPLAQRVLGVQVADNLDARFLATKQQIADAV